MTGLSFCLLASGSKGNSIWVEAEGQALLIDAGLSGRELTARMALRGLEPKKLTAILLTHEHIDHARSAGVLARRFNLPLYLNAPTLKRAAPLLGKIEPRLFLTGHSFELGPFLVHAFATSHDAAEPVGFTFGLGKDPLLGLATDMGQATHLARQRLGGVAALILEANHDPTMLHQGPYPWPLKQRIRSRQGHLSNEDSAELLAQLAHEGLGRVVLAHLSETNNLPEKALAAATARLNGQRPLLCAAAQNEPSEVFYL